MKQLEHQEATLNIWYHLPDKILNKVPDIFPCVPGWLGKKTEGDLKGYPFWFSFNINEKHVSHSFELSGFKLIGKMNDQEWNQWITTFKVQATCILGFKVGDIEDGEVDYELEWIKS